jgi:hypothetical protein
MVCCGVKIGRVLEREADFACDCKVVLEQKLEPQRSHKLQPMDQELRERAWRPVGWLRLERQLRPCKCGLSGIAQRTPIYQCPRARGLATGCIIVAYRLSSLPCLPVFTLQRHRQPTRMKESLFILGFSNAATYSQDVPRSSE